MDEGFHERFVISPVVNELFTLALIRVVLSQLQQSSHGKAGWGRGTGGGGGFSERFVILPVVNKLFTLAFH